MRKRSGTKKEYLQRVVRDFMHKHKLSEVDPDALTAWAIDTNLIADEPSSFFKRTKKDLVQAMRDERRPSPQTRCGSGGFAPRMATSNYDHVKSHSSLPHAPSALAEIEIDSQSRMPAAVTDGCSLVKAKSNNRTNTCPDLAPAIVRKVDSQTLESSCSKSALDPRF